MAPPVSIMRRFYTSAPENLLHVNINVLLNLKHFYSHTEKMFESHFISADNKYSKKKIIFFSVQHGGLMHNR